MLRAASLNALRVYLRCKYVFWLQPRLCYGFEPYSTTKTLARRTTSQPVFDPVDGNASVVPPNADGRNGTIQSPSPPKDPPAQAPPPTPLQDVDPTTEPGQGMAPPHAPLPSWDDDTAKTWLSETEHRALLFHVLRTTSSATKGWSAYRTLRMMVQPSAIPLAHLHRLASLLAATKPRTRTLFLSLQSLLNDIRKAGGTLYLWERNALIHCAGMGWRKPDTKSFQNALNIFSDSFGRGLQETEGSLPDANNGLEGGGTFSQAALVKPDIISYTSLIGIAVRTQSPQHVQHSTLMLKYSGLAPNHVTHLTLLRYFTKHNKLEGVRTTIKKMREQKLGLGLEIVNAVLWANASQNRMDLASIIYRILRHNAIPERSSKEHGISDAIHYLSTVLDLDIPKSMVPDDITYIIMIQAFAYHGELIPALQVFSDMVTMQSSSPPSARDVQTKVRNLEPGKALFVAFRALFLGFARHATAPPLSQHSTRGPHQPLFAPKERSQWTLEYLDALFDSFLTIPGAYVPSERLIYWILAAFKEASCRDVGKMRDVLARLDKRFGGKWSRGRLGRLRTEIMKGQLTKEKRAKNALRLRI